MIKFMILFDAPEDAERFENIYADFLALVERMPNILRRQVVHVTGSPQGKPRIYRILEIYFASVDAQTEALMSPVGQEAGAELQKLPKDSYQLLMTDVYEEEGGSTPASSEGESAGSEDETAADDAPSSADGQQV